MKVEEKTWRGAPDMREARYCFNPCLINSKVWLCGYGTMNIELFDPETNEFLPSPSAQLPESHFCCTVEHEGCLLVVSYSYITRYKIEGNGLTKMEERREQVSRTVWQNSNPRVLGSNVFFSENNTWCWINVKEGGRLKMKG